MSRTDAHTPEWVVALREGYESHDHRKGVCDLAARESGFIDVPRLWRHRSSCKKFLKVTVLCRHTWTRATQWISGTDGYCPVPYHKYSPKAHSTVEILIAATGVPLTKTERETYADAIICVPFEQGYAARSAARSDRRDAPRFILENNRFGTHSYTVSIPTPEVPCSCDTFPTYPTCDYSLPREESHRYYCSYPGRHLQPRTTRSAERDTLRQMAAAYNSGHEDFEEDFPLAKLY